MFCVTTFQINYILYYYLVYNHHLCIINFIYYNTLCIIYCNIQANYHNITMFFAVLNIIIIKKKYN